MAILCPDNAWEAGLSETAASRLSQGQAQLESLGIGERETFRLSWSRSKMLTVRLNQKGRNIWVRRLWACRGGCGDSDEGETGEKRRQWETHGERRDGR
jgi:hypothetical protein